MEMPFHSALVAKAEFNLLLCRGSLRLIAPWLVSITAVPFSVAAPCAVATLAHLITTEIPFLRFHWRTHDVRQSCICYLYEYVCTVFGAVPTQLGPAPE